MSNSTSLSEEAASVSSTTRIHPDFTSLNPLLPSFSDIHHPPQKPKKKRSLPGNPGTTNFSIINVSVFYFLFLVFYSIITKQEKLKFKTTRNSYQKQMIMLCACMFFFSFQD